MGRHIIITLIIVVINATTTFASNLYVRGDIGMNKLVTEKQSNLMVNGAKLKLKSQNFASIDIGVGYYLFNNLRAELLLSHLINPTTRGSSRVFSEEHKANINALLLGASLDIFSVGYANIILNGGIGFSQVSEKVTMPNFSYTYKHKKQTNVCWNMGTGVNLDVGRDVIIEGRYIYTDFGKAKSLVTITSPNHKVHALKLGLLYKL